jgi:four helix bundle protein
MSEEMKMRTKRFSLRCIDLALALPETDLGRTIRRQLMRCGTGVGAGYRAAARAKSPADFIAKMGTVEEETDECMFWMEIIMDKGMMEKDRVEGLHSEANEILSIVVASIKAARKNQ